MDCTLQVSAALEKQVRAKEKELIAFQEEYKIRVKVSRTCLEGSMQTVGQAFMLVMLTYRAKETKMKRLIRHLPAKRKKVVLGSWSQNSRNKDSAADACLNQST